MLVFAQQKPACTQNFLSLLSSRMIIDLAQYHLIYLIDTLLAIYLSQLILLLVVVEYLPHFIEEGDQPFSHRFSRIIRTLIETTSVQITYICHSGWMKLGMINMGICLTEYSARQPLE